MSEQERHPERTPAHWPPDSELRVRTVVLAGIALAAATAIAAVAMWYLSIALRERMEARDPAPPVLLEAMAPYEPPSPRLETQPEQQLWQLRAEEREMLDTYGWVDESSGVARVPIERGIELLLELRPDGRAFGGTGEGLPAGAVDQPEGDGGGQEPPPAAEQGESNG